MSVITIKDVAALAGVSTATASRVLSGNPATSPESRDRVAAAVAQLDFKPNAQARALRSSQTHTIGLLVSDIRNPFFADLAHAVEQAALQAGYVTLLCNANEQTSQQDLYIDTMISQRVDGIIVTPQGDGGGSISSLIARKIPTVFVDRTISGLDVPSVTTDSDIGIRQAVAHLIDTGHTRIGYIAGPQNVSTGHDRLESYTRAMKTAGLTIEPELIFHGDFQADSGSAAVHAFLSLADPPTAILAADSLMAVGALAMLTRRQVELGSQMALIAFDDIEWFALLNPALSVIAHSAEEMGATSVQLLKQVIDGDHPASVHLPSELIVRASSSAHPRARRN